MILMATWSSASRIEATRRSSELTIVVPGASRAVEFFGGGLIQTAVGEIRHVRPTVHEALGMGRVGGHEHLLPLRADRGGLAEVHDGGREKSQAAVTVLVVVPGEEALAERAPVFERAEAIRELRTVLQGLELRFRERVVVGDVGAAVGLGDAEVGQEQRHGLVRHRRAAVGMDRELARGECRASRRSRR